MADSEITLWARAQDALAERLRARPRYQRGPDPTPVDVGWPEPVQQPEHVWIAGAIDDWLIEWQSTGIDGAGAQVETFTLTIHLAVMRSADAWSEIRDQVVELAAEVFTICRVDPTLGGIAQRLEVFGGELYEGGPVDGVRQGVLELKVRVETHLGATTVAL